MSEAETYYQGNDAFNRNKKGNQFAQYGKSQYPEESKYNVYHTLNNSARNKLKDILFKNYANVSIRADELANSVYNLPQLRYMNMNFLADVIVFNDFKGGYIGDAEGYDTVIIDDQEVYTVKSGKNRDVETEVDTIIARDNLTQGLSAQQQKLLKARLIAQFVRYYEFLHQPRSQLG